MSKNRGKRRIESRPDHITEMIELAAKWVAFGDIPAEEIWVRFGLDRVTFGFRLLRALGSSFVRYPDRSRIVALAVRLARLDDRQYETAGRRV